MTNRAMTATGPDRAQDAARPSRPGASMTRHRRIGLAITLGVMLLVGAGPFAGPLLSVPANAAAMAARSVCSGRFVAGRPWRDVLAQDVRPANPVLRWVDLRVDDAAGTVTARFAGGFERTAAWHPERGCVLRAADERPPAPATVRQPIAGFAGAAAPRPDRGAAPAASVGPPAAAGAAPAGPRPAAPRPAPWPEGDAALAPSDWGPSIDVDRLNQVVRAAFEGAGDPRAANARGLAIVHLGRLLVNRGAPGFEAGTPLHGWSMTKTVVAMLAHQIESEQRLDRHRRLVDAFPAGREPPWVAQWRADGRAAITVEDLVYMRDGLGHREAYGALGSVPQMLWGERDAAAFAAGAAAEAPPGRRWQYLSASSNLLSRELRARFATDAEYHAYPRQALFDPIGARSALLETDADGTWIGSSYLWASASDWARLGWLMLDDGRWQGRQLLAPGWLARAATPAQPDGEGRGYGAHTWRFGDPQAGRCRGHGLPEDLLAMSGHWGQLVAMVPSRELVIVRLGWTFDRTRFDPCALVSQVLAAFR